MDLTSRMLIAPLAVALDAFLGEPRRLHPLVGFGRLASLIEQPLYGSAEMPKSVRRLRGILALVMLLLPFLVMAWGLERWPETAPIAELFGLYLTLGARSLREHALAVHEKLALGQLQQAREAVARMVGRDTHNLNEERVTVAAVESVLENGLDAIFGALFWFTAAGLPGAVLYRLTNTLDALWGYRDARYGDFGWAAARLDDTLNFVPARLTALSYVLLAVDRRVAWWCWRTQARHWKSPNAGPTMAAGAGALHTLLGGSASYHGVVKNRPILGMGYTARPEDIPRAVQLVQRALLVWVGCILTGGFALA